MHNNLIDNSCDALSMRTYIKRCIDTEGINQIQIATGYWDIPGMALIIDELESFLDQDGHSLQLLIGKDPYVYTSLLAKPKYMGAKYPNDFIRTDIHDLEVKDEYKSVINLLLKHGESGKIQIRLYSRNSQDETEFLHSKCYIFSGPENSLGIIGSSNFTQKGLLGNAELNYLETDPTRITARPTRGSNAKGHICWFEERWDISTDWTQEFLEQIIKKSPIYIDTQKDKPKEFTPYELYIKLLQLQFGDVVDQNVGEQIKNYLPLNIKRYDYQIEAVKRCISIMHEHGGFMLADVVGLGKTIVGTLIIKRFLTVPEDDGRERKVLIITPPAIQSGWKKAVAMFDENSNEKISPYIDYITTGSIGNIVEDEILENDNDEVVDTGEFDETLQDKNYGLIIIDESHKFRNSNTKMYQSLDELIGKIGSETGVYPYIGLLSATPQNNRPNDLKNQIYLFQRNHTESTLKKAEGGNLQRFFGDIGKEYDLLIQRTKSDLERSSSTTDEISANERRQRLQAISKKIRDCILSDILERRTRTDIEKYYSEDMKSQGLVFPKTVGPNSLKYTMDKELAQLFADTMSMVAPTEEEMSQTDEWIGYFRYRAIEYFSDPEKEEKYRGRGNRGVQNISRQLATIMQMLLVKRLESSFAAFTQSLLNLRRYTENMIKMWENNTIFICPQIDINKELDREAKSKKRGRKVSFEECVKDIRKKINKLDDEGRNEAEQNAEYTRQDFKEEYYTKLKKDQEIISSLYDRWARNSQDPKFDAFKENLVSVLFDPNKNTSRKLVIFSEAIDTVNSLARAVKAKGYKVLVITASNRDKKEKTIEENFDANYEEEWKNDYDVIITTEVLAEGVNLHRANVILNYDTPWNSTRLMQRIGRVNRIGSQEEFIYVYNFLPSAEGDAQIQLVRKAYTKLQSFHTLFGEDSKIFSEDEEVVHYGMAKPIEEEESPMQKYLFELKQYKEAHPDRYKQIEQTTNGWEIAQVQNGTAYFIVKAPGSSKLAIKVETNNGDNLSANIISILELLEDMRVDKNARSIPLPDNWAELTKQAKIAYNQYFVRINKSRSGDKRIKAISVIVKLFNSKGISEESRSLLKRARILVDKGSFDLIKKMIAIGNILHLEEAQQSFFELTQEEIDDILEHEIGKLVAHVENRQGQATIVLGTIK